MSALNQDKQSITVLGKGNKERLVYCSDAVRQRVTHWLEIRQTKEGVPEVFCAVTKDDQLNENNRLTEDAIFKILKARALEFGIDQVAPHDLRRTYATRLFELGGNVYLVRHDMGHASILTTQRYDKRGEEAVKKLARLISL